MQELEIKILEIDKNLICSKIESLGGIKTFDGAIVTTYYDFIDKHLSKENRQFRLRQKGETWTLTYKDRISKSEANIRNEYETNIDDGVIMQTILEKMELTVIGLLSKHRVSFSLNTIHIDIDTITGIPTFMEIEAPSLEELKKYVELFGYTMNDTKNWAYDELIRHYNLSLTFK